MSHAHRVTGFIILAFLLIVASVEIMLSLVGISLLVVRYA